MTSLLALAVSLLVGQARAADLAPSDLAAAKALYASASYEAALSHLSTVRNPDDEVQVEEYRALCLLALGRAPEAERTLERIVTRQPLYVATDEDVSPRLVAMLHDVRKRLLPAAARTVYANAEASYDHKDYAEAASGFTELLAIVNDPDSAEAAASLGDLKQLSEGFLALANAQLAVHIYSSDDADVTPPMTIEGTMPAWTPKDPAIARLEFRGTLEVVVDERGNVESVAIRRSILESYDPALVEAAKHWRFTPAMRHGEPVRYRRFIDVVLRSARSSLISR